jgi:hypothetical protein
LICSLVCFLHILIPRNGKRHLSVATCYKRDKIQGR